MIRQNPVSATAVISTPQANCVRTSISGHFLTFAFHAFLPFCRQVNIPLDTYQQIVYTFFSARHETLKAIPIEAGDPAHRLPGPTSELKQI